MSSGKLETERDANEIAGGLSWEEITRRKTEVLLYNDEAQRRRDVAFIKKLRES